MIFRSKGRVADKAAPSVNGGSAPRPSVATAKEANRKGEPSPAKTARPRPRDVRQARMTQTFAQVVAVLMRDPNFRNLRLADLEWLVLPPIMAGQFRLAHAMRPTAVSKADKAPRGGVSVPVAVALWARVSADIDKGLLESLDKPVHLRPNQWSSGDNVWLMAAGGDRRALPHFLKQLADDVLKGQHVKMRQRGSDGQVVVKALGQDK